MAEASDRYWREILLKTAHKFRRSAPASSEEDENWVQHATGILENSRCPNPVRAAQILSSVLDVSPQIRSNLLAVEVTILLAGASAWASQLLVVHPYWAEELGCALSETRDRKSFPNYSNAIEKIYHKSDDLAQLEVGLRRFRSREVLRIGLYELLDVDIRRTSRAMSDLADSCVQVVLRFHYERLLKLYGPVVPSCRMLVLALGKLGGQELNLSSDIDVMYIYEHDDGYAGKISTHEFHVKLFESITRSLSVLTIDGRIFRVDTDLRPEGRNGALCNSLSGLEKYYEQWGRAWERAMWLKARPIAGDLDLYPDLMKFICPFVFRASQDIFVIKEILELKNQVSQAARRARLRKNEVNLKLGVGGIREIELISQALQLIHGGKDIYLRKRNTLESLRVLEVGGWITSRDRRVLSDSYLFLRRLEHRIQFVDNRQTHSLPLDPELTEIAKSLGFSSATKLTEELEKFCFAAHERFKIFLGGQDASITLPLNTDNLMDVAVSASEKEAELTKLGFMEPAKSAASLLSLTRVANSPYHPAAPPRLRELGAQIIIECINSPDMDQSLQRLPQLIRPLVCHKEYLLRLENPELRRKVVHILGVSELLTSILVSSRDSLLVVLFQSEPTPLDRIKSVVQEALDPAKVEESLVRLRELKHQEVMRLAIAELSGRLSHQESQLHMTTLAEACVEGARSLAFADLTRRYGTPEDSSAGMVICGGGTLGAMELGHLSDLDLSVYYVGDGYTTGGPSGKISLDEFYTRVVQRLLNFLTLRSVHGSLFAVDMRLRPSGSQGTLVTSLKRFMQYHARGIQLWERQALVRSRVISGPPMLREQVQKIFNNSMYLVPPVIKQTQIINVLRHRFFLKAGRAGPLESSHFHVKHGHGGLIEIEFMIQHLLLGLGFQPIPRVSSNTRDILERLVEFEVLSERISKRLDQIHTRFRRLLSWARLIHDEPLEIVQLDTDSTRVLGHLLGHSGRNAGTSLQNAVEEDRRYVHSVYTDKMQDWPLGN
ncbi:MAG: bifunctional [glutamate--ammonia ligase]-adenylyl-L-tyrosine phosphorylase/[glutamate--ammonia-ligase] adenylyltransferase [Myxococcales bacterium]|nr:bifunctional [glutamate--ammonia ligase]-adenylyl-L-tyrosine phosphorylase/[glutamate--ammonia-ligase] adenylyltransferase [Myxococcales bacterium]